MKPVCDTYGKEESFWGHSPVYIVNVRSVIRSGLRFTSTIISGSTRISRCERPSARFLVCIWWGAIWRRVKDIKEEEQQ